MLTLLAMMNTGWAASVDCDAQPDEVGEAVVFSSSALEARRTAKRLLAACNQSESSTRVPGFDTGLGVMWRDGAAVGGMPFDIGVEAVRHQRFSFRIGMGFTGFRRIYGIDEQTEPDQWGWWGGLQRQLGTSTVDAAFQFEPVRSLRVEAVAGMGWYTFRQQWRQIDVIPSPTVGAGLELNLFKSIGVRGRLTTDLRPIKMYRSDGSLVEFSPVRLSAAVFYRYGGTRRMPTLDNFTRATGSRWRRSIANLPGLRLSGRVDAREGHLITGGLEVGVEALRSGPFALEVNVGYQGRRDLRIIGPWRSVEAFDASLDGWYEVGEFLAVGASAGASLRQYRQDWQPVSAPLIPFVGLRTYTPIVRAQSWSVGLDTRTTVDLVPTQLILDTAAVLATSPLDVQVGLRFQFGYRETAPKPVSPDADAPQHPLEDDDA